jgi:hypothetical protein
MNRNKTKNKSKKNGKKSSKKNKGQEGFKVTRHLIGFPSTIKSKPIFTRVLRYRVGTAFQDKNFAMTSLLHHIVWVTNASTAAFSMIDAIKLRRITLYSVPSTNFGGNVNEISLKWINLGTFGNTMTDRGTLSDPAKIVAVPPLHSLISFAFNINDTNIGTTFCVINAPQESIIDFLVEFTLLDGAGTAVTLSGAATYTGIAFTSPSLGTLIPDGVTTPVTTTST